MSNRSGAQFVFGLQLYRAPVQSCALQISFLWILVLIVVLVGYEKKKQSSTGTLQLYCPCIGYHCITLESLIDGTDASTASGTTTTTSTR
eukprot:1371061-Rhodomonas_salina.1